MTLEHIVNTFFSKSNSFYNRSGNRVPPDEITKKYYSIKNYLNQNYKKQDKIAVYLEKDYHYVLLMLVCFELGLIFIPLNKKWPKQRIEDILSIATPEVLILDSEIDIKYSKISFQDILQSSSVKINLESSFISQNNIAYIIFTSGSTGNPKGVMIKRESYVNFVNWVDTYFSEISSYDKLLNTADFTFDLSLIDIALLLSKNLHFYISSIDNNIFELIAEIEEFNITTMATVPNSFQMILSKGVFDRADISSLKFLLIGGARFSYGLYLKFKEKMQNVNIYNLYGPTEATVYCSVKKINFDDNDLYGETISVGSAIMNTTLKIIDDNENEVPSNTRGKLLIGGIQVMESYINNDEKNRNVLLSYNGEKYYDTGDVSFEDDNGNIFIVGRVDDTIKTDGYRVNLSDVDSNIQKLNYIEECATIALEDKIKENILVSFLKINSEVSIKYILNDLMNIVPSYQIPKKLILIEEFPLNSSGKICKKTIKSNYIKSRG